MTLLAIGALALWGSDAAASTDQSAGLGVGLRVGSARQGGWTYVPVLLGVELDVTGHAAIGVRAELADGYFAFRPGVTLLACSVGGRQCLDLGGSMGVASASFEAADRRTALLFGGSLAYQNRLGPTRYAVRVEGELLFAHRGGTMPGWRAGLGMSLYVLRTF